MRTFLKPRCRIKRRDLIECYKLILDNIFSRGKGILGSKFISKHLKKAKKVTSDDGLTLLKGIEFSQGELQLMMVFKNFGENESAHTGKVISEKFNTIIELVNKALNLLLGKDKGLKILKDGTQDAKVKNAGLFEKE